MPIEFHCPECNQFLRTPDGTEGQNAKCPKCGALVMVPAAAAPPPPAPVPGPAEENPFVDVGAQGGQTARANPFADVDEPSQPYGPSSASGSPSSSPGQVRANNAGQVCSILSLVFGSLAFLGSCCCVFVSMPFGIAGVVLGIVGS